MSDTPDRPSDLSRIFGEFLVRRQLGESPFLDEYCQRFPALAEQLRLHVRLFDALGEAGPGTEAGLVRVFAMPDEPRVQRLLEELASSDASPEVVCRSCPELLPRVRERWQQICRVQAELDATDAQPQQTDCDDKMFGKPQG